MSPGSAHIADQARNINKDHTERTQLFGRSQRKYLGEGGIETALENWERCGKETKKYQGQGLIIEKPI